MAGVIIFSAIIACAIAYPNPNYQYGYDGLNANLYPSDYQPRSALVEDPQYDPNTNVAPPSADDLANFNPFAYTPLTSFIQRMQDSMRKVQTQMGEVLSRLPPQDIDWSKLGNTTSHTEIVNDHVVTVNETTYKNSNDGSASVLHIRVVDVKPTTSVDGTSPSSTEGIQDTSEDEKRRTNRASIVARHFPDGQIMKRRDPQQIVNLNPTFLDSVDNSIDIFKPTNPNDLSRDTLVNNLRQDQTKGGLVMVDPNAELIDVVDGQVQLSDHAKHADLQQRTRPIFNWNK